jgi:hypothetical protein
MVRGFQEFLSFFSPGNCLHEIAGKYLKNGYLWNLPEATSLTILQTAVQKILKFDLDMPAAMVTFIILIGQDIAGVGN